MSKIRWGILSTAKIGREHVIPALQKSEWSEVVAISSRSEEKAKEVAEKLNISRSHGSYEALLDDTDIDAVYNPLPNHLHLKWSVKALEAGKHVLCEKPIGMSAEEAGELARQAKNHLELKVMEAFMYRYHPQWEKVKELVQGGRIGTLKTIRSVFCYFKDDPDDIRNKPELGGGGLMDVGCYNISLSRHLFEEEPERVVSQIEYDPDLGIDRVTSGLMEFSSGTASFTCGTQLADDQQVTIYGTDGRIEIELPFNMPPEKSAVIRVYSGDDEEKIIFEPADQYTLQGDVFAHAVINDIEVPYPLEDAIGNMRVIDAVFESGEKNKWVNLQT